MSLSLGAHIAELPNSVTPLQPVNRQTPSRANVNDGCPCCSETEVGVPPWGISVSSGCSPALRPRPNGSQLPTNSPSPPERCHLDAWSRGRRSEDVRGPPPERRSKRKTKTGAEYLTQLGCTPLRRIVGRSLGSLLTREAMRPGDLERTTVDLREWTEEVSRCVYAFSERFDHAFR